MDGRVERLARAWLVLLAIILILDCAPAFQHRSFVQLSKLRVPRHRTGAPRGRVWILLADRRSDVKVTLGTGKPFAASPEEANSKFWEVVWYNCDALTRRCLGNALDDPSYRQGVLTVAGLTLIFSSNSPALHSLYTSIEHHPPVTLLNAGAGVAAAVGMLLAGDSLQKAAPCKVVPRSEEEEGERLAKAKWAGAELGLWKALAATANLFGLALTSASHGAFLIQLTTLIVPLAQGFMGIPIARQIWGGVALALTGLFLFTNDPASASSSSLTGDALCVLAAVFYATYDLRLFHFGKQLGDAPAALIENKVVTQAALSVALVVGLVAWQRVVEGRVDEVTAFLQCVSPTEALLIVPVMLWSGMVVNAAASVMQVGAQQAVGAARAQVIYATGPLWSAVMSMLLLGEKAGTTALVGGAVFLVALLVAATAPPPEAVCNEQACEV